MIHTFLTTVTEKEQNELLEMYIDWVKSLDIYQEFGIKLPSPLDNVYFFGIMLIVVAILTTCLIVSFISGFFEKISIAKHRRRIRKREREHDRKMQELAEKREERELRREERELRMEEKQDKRFEQQMQAQMQAQEMMNLYTQFMVAAKMQNIPALMDMSYDKWLVMYNAQQAKQEATQQPPSVIYQGTTSDYVDVTVRDVEKPMPVKKTKPVKEKVVKEKPIKEKKEKESSFKNLFGKKSTAVAEDAVETETVTPVAEPISEPISASSETPVAEVHPAPTVVPTDIYEDESEATPFVPDKKEVVAVEDEPEGTEQPVPEKIYIVPDDEPEDIVEIPEYTEEEEKETVSEAVSEPIDTSDVEDEDDEDLSSMDTEDAFAMLLRSIQAQETQQKSIDKSKTKKQSERDAALSQLNNETVKHSDAVKVLNSTDEIERKKEKARLAREKELAKAEAKKKKKK